MNPLLVNTLMKDKQLQILREASAEGQDLSLYNDPKMDKEVMSLILACQQVRISPELIKRCLSEMPTAYDQLNALEYVHINRSLTDYELEQLKVFMGHDLIRMVNSGRVELRDTPPSLFPKLSDWIDPSDQLLREFKEFIKGYDIYDNVIADVIFLGFLYDYDLRPYLYLGNTSYIHYCFNLLQMGIDPNPFLDKLLSLGQPEVMIDHVRNDQIINELFIAAANELDLDKLDLTAVNALRQQRQHLMKLKNTAN